MGVNLDGVRKDMQAVKAKLKQLMDERRELETEISKVETELDTATTKRETAYETIRKLKTQRDEGVCWFTFHSNHESLTQFRLLVSVI